MKKNKLFMLLGVSTALLGGTVSVQNMTMPNKVEASSLATKYGATKRFTVPKKFRGTWVAKSKKTAFKKIKLTAHTIVLSKPAKDYGSKAGGTWKLWTQSGKWYDKHLFKASGEKPSKYADKHKWMPTRKDNKNTVFFKYGWLRDDDRSFNLKYKSAKKLQFVNTRYINNYYKK